MVERGDLIPHFVVTNLQGTAVAYSTIWQRRNLVLVTIPASDPDRAFSDYVSRVLSEIPGSADTGCVITRDVIPGIPHPGVVVADRWGEIVHVAAGRRVAELPHPDELIEWVTHLQHRCPECEGEAK